MLEYTCHPQAHLHLSGGADREGDRARRVIPVAAVEAGSEGQIQPVAPAEKAVTVRVIEAGSGLPVPVKLHIHGAWGEYLPPVDRHRSLNPGFFEDYSPDFMHIVDWDQLARTHASSYIRGETLVKLPLGTVYIEVSKGFEIRPVRTTVEVGPDTDTVVIEIAKVLPWREKGWVTADTHVHFLSPTTAMLEGAAEGVNVINLLASQWGELMTNVGDFDGRNTWGARSAGGDGEYLVRVGTENRQHVLGHISLLGYEGTAHGSGMIAPMTTGGPDESALGDPVEITADRMGAAVPAAGRAGRGAALPQPPGRACRGHRDGRRRRGGDDVLGRSLQRHRPLLALRLVPLPQLRLRGAGGRRHGQDDDGNGGGHGAHVCPHRIPGVEFTYEAWKEAVRRGETFVTYGPLLEFSVDGHPHGQPDRDEQPRGDGRRDVGGGERDGAGVARRAGGQRRDPREHGRRAAARRAASWQVRMDRSGWLAILVRGRQPGKPEMIAAHSSPVTVMVEGSPLLAAADAVTILDQIEGAMVFLDTIGTRAEDRAYKRMRLELDAAYRTLHRRMHEEGHYHEHTGGTSHQTG